MSGVPAARWLRVGAAMTVLAALVACRTTAPVATTPAPPPEMQFEVAAWSALPGWKQDALADAWPALQASCRTTRLDAAARRVEMADGAVLEYDYLIVASGSSHAYFGHEEWEPFAPGLKTLEDAITIRRRILIAFERAERETDPARRRELLTLVLVGGGPTGVELAGTLAEILPDARPQLETVAAAKVEVAYGGRKLGVDRLLSLRDAQRRLRTSLLRLALRRDARRRRR